MCPWLARMLAFATLGLGCIWAEASKPVPHPPSAERGLPFLRNFPAREYGAFFQNWCVTQDPRGLIYVGNNFGVLEYDGVRWRLIRTEGKTTPRALAVDAQGRIYVGAMGEFGYLAPNAQGSLHFVSLLDQLPAEDRAFSDIWSISFADDGIYFQAFQRLFRIQGNQVRVWKPQGNFQFAAAPRGRLWVRDTAVGLLEMVDNTLRPLPGGEKFKEERVRSLLPWTDPTTGKPGILIATQTQGFFSHDGETLRPHRTAMDATLREAQIFQVLPLKDQSLVVATRYQGLLHLSLDGHSLLRLGRTESLPTESVFALGSDAQSGAWLALQKGISRVELAAPATTFDERRGLPGSVTVVRRLQGNLHVGTDQGFFRLETQGPLQGRFLPVPGHTGPAWDMVAWEDHHLVGGSEGLFTLKGRQARPLWKFPSTLYCLLRSRRDPQRIFVGLQIGLTSLRREGSAWVDEGLVPGLTGQVRSLVEAEDGSLWVGTATSGVFHLDLAEGPGRTVKSLQAFGVQQGLPSLNHTYVHWLGGALKVSSHAGVYRLKPDKGGFEADPAFADLFPEGPRWVYGLREDAQGRIWLHSSNEQRGLNESGCAIPSGKGDYRWEGRPCLRFAGSWMESLLPEADGIVWLGGAEGLVRLDTNQSTAFDRPFATLLRRVGITGSDLLFDGAWPTPRPDVLLPYRDNSLRFEFAAPSYGLENATTYQTWLEGNDEAWSPWSAEPFKDYTNLAEGAYRFRVRARNAYGVVGTEDSFSFRVFPPWYRAWWAYLLYALVTGTTLSGLLRWRLSTLQARNAELEAKVAARTADLAARNAELLALDGTVQAINREVAVQPLLEAILLQSLRQFPQAEKGAILIQSEEDGLFRVHAAMGYEGPAYEGIAFTADEILARYTIGTQALGGGVFLVRDLHDAEGAHHLGGLPLPESLLAMSLVFEEQVAGFLVLESFTDAEAFQTADVDRLKRFREHAVSALGKARMFDRLELAGAQLRELNQQKNQFLGIVAHDLRNPLSSIVLAAQLLEDEQDLTEVTRVARMIHQEGNEMSALIGRFLDIAAIESGAIKANLELLSPLDIAHHVAKRHAPKATAKQMTLEFEGAESSPLVWADIKFLKEVLDNLLSNAIKFSPLGARIGLRVSPEAGGARIAVADQGPGLTAEDRKRLFGRFARLSARPTAGEKSTGLGLSIVKHMVEAMGGRLGVESEPGQGATFWVWLPTTTPEGSA